MDGALQTRIPFETSPVLNGGSYIHRGTDGHQYKIIILRDLGPGASVDLQPLFFVSTL